MKHSKYWNISYNTYHRDKTSKDGKSVHLSNLKLDNKLRCGITFLVLYIYLYISLISLPTLYVSITIFMDKNRIESVKPKVTGILKPICAAQF